MKRLFNKAFNIFLFMLGTNRAKNLLWKSLKTTLKKTYSPGGEGEYKCWLQISKHFKKPVVIDVGANVGQLTETFLQIFPKTIVYAIEPVPEFFNKIDDQNLGGKYNHALSNKTKNITIYQSGGGAKPFPKNVKGKATIAHRVRAITGDEFVKVNNIKKLDIIKIDTDGFDFEVLIGFSDTIVKFQPIIQFELSHWWLHLGYTIKQAQLLFEEWGYSLCLMTDNGLCELDIREPDSLFITANIMAIPKNKINKEIFSENIS